MDDVWQEDEHFVCSLTIRPLYPRTPQQRHGYRVIRWS